MHGEFREKSETCPGCRAAGKNLKTNIPGTELNLSEILSEQYQEIQLDFAGSIKCRTRSDVYVSVAIDRCSEWTTAHIRKNTDARTVLKNLTEYCSDKGTPFTIRTDNGSFFKRKEFEEFCASGNIDGFGVHRIHTAASNWWKEQY